MQAKALGSGLPDRSSLEEVEGPRAAGYRVDRLRPEDVHRPDDGVDPSPMLSVHAVSHPQHRDDQSQVGLHGGDDVGRGDGMLIDDRQQAVAGLDQRRKRLQGLEGGGEAAAVPFVVATGPRGNSRRAVDVITSLIYPIGFARDGVQAVQFEIITAHQHPIRFA